MAFRNPRLVILEAAGWEIGPAIHGGYKAESPDGTISIYEETYRDVINSAWATHKHYGW